MLPIEEEGAKLQAIRVSAARFGGEVLTANVRHFQSSAAFARAGGLDVVVSEG